MKKILSVLLCAAMLLAADAIPVAAASQATASTIRLEQTSGRVTVKNASGNAVNAGAGTRLQSGYKLSTEKASYAYISLDSSKAAKLDASSRAKIKKSGNKLELLSEKGKLMFNVSKPLKSTESMNVRTSTMVAGIRGTAGWIDSDAQAGQASDTEIFFLLEGSSQVTVPDPVTGGIHTVTISGGQGICTCTGGEASDRLILDEAGGKAGIPGIDGGRDIVSLTGGDSLKMLVFDFEERDIPGFVAAAVAEDASLQEKIRQFTDLSVEAIIAGADERLAADEAAAETADAAIQEALSSVVATPAPGKSQMFNTIRHSGGGSGDKDRPVQGRDQGR